jgi:hypothetical protein
MYNQSQSFFAAPYTENCKNMAFDKKTKLLKTILCFKRIFSEDRVVYTEFLMSPIFHKKQGTSFNFSEAKLAISSFHTFFAKSKCILNRCKEKRETLQKKKNCANEVLFRTFITQCYKPDNNICSSYESYLLLLFTFKSLVLS